MRQSLALFVLLSACAPPYIQQPRVAASAQTVGSAEPSTPATAPDVRAYLARELCAHELEYAMDVQVSAGNSLGSAREITAELCERPEVWAPFARFLDDATVERMREARRAAMEAVP